MAFNIKSQAVVDTAFLHLRDAVTDEKILDETGKPVGIELYGKASKQYRQALSELSRKALQRKNKPQSFETNVEDNVGILVSISKKAVNMDYEGKPIDSAAMFTTLYSDPTLYFVKDQVQEFLEDTAAFTQK